MPVQSLAARLCAAVLAALSLPLLSGCGAQADQQSAVGPRITIGIDADLPGLAVMRAGAVNGFNADVARYIARDLGYAENQIVWRQMTPDRRTSMLQGGDVDILAASLVTGGATERAEDVAGPYLTVRQDLLVRNGSHLGTGTSALDDKTVCTARGTDYARTVRRVFSGRIHFMLRRSYDECVTALLLGSADAVSADDIILAGLASAHGGGQLRLQGRPFATDRFGIGVRAGSKELVRKIDAALIHMVDDGSWHRALESASRSIGYAPDAALNPPKVTRSGL